MDQVYRSQNGDHPFFRIVKCTYAIPEGSGTVRVRKKIVITQGVYHTSAVEVLFLARLSAVFSLCMWV